MLVDGETWRCNDSLKTPLMLFYQEISRLIRLIGFVHWISGFIYSLSRLGRWFTKLQYNDSDESDHSKLYRWQFEKVYGKLYSLMMRTLWSGVEWISTITDEHQFIVCSFPFLSLLEQKYEFFVAPFYRSVEGQPSNSKIVQTFEDGKWKYEQKRNNHRLHTFF